MVVLLAFVGIIAAGCDAGAPPVTPPIVPGGSGSPREVNLIAKDYSFLPDALDLAPGETVLLHVINGGLEVHEAVIGDAATQDAWEVVSVPPGVSGLRIVVKSGERVDLVWTVPDVSPTVAWQVGCHIPGHWARGMQIPVRWAGSAQAS